MAIPYLGAAISVEPSTSGELMQLDKTKPLFSTSLGAMELLGAENDIANPPVIFDYDEELDVSSAYAAGLKKRFPDKCKQIESPNSDLSILFDHSDIYIIGIGVLQAAVQVIAYENGVRKAAVAEFARGFYKHHKFRAQKFLSGGRTDIFSDEETKEYGEEFLSEVLDHLKITHKPVIPLNMGTVGGRIAAIQSSIPPVSPSAAGTPTVVKQAQEGAVYRIPVSGADNKLRPRRGSAPPLMEFTEMQEFRRQQELVDAKARVLAAPEQEVATHVGSKANTADNTMATTPVTTVDMSREQTWQTQSTFVTNISDEHGAHCDATCAIVNDGMLPRVDELRDPSLKQMSGNSNPSEDGHYDAPHPALTPAVRPSQDSSTFDKPQFRRPRGDSLMHRAPAYRYSAQHRLNRGPQHQQALSYQHMPQGMPYMATGLMTGMPTNVPQYPMIPGAYVPGHPTQMGPRAQMGAPGMGMVNFPHGMPPIPFQQAGPWTSPHSASQHAHFTQGHNFENQHPGGQISGPHNTAGYMPRNIYPAPFMVGPPHGQVATATDPFYPVPNMPHQFGHVSPPSMALRREVNAVAGQGARRESFASQTSSEARARKNPIKTFTDDVRLLENMDEEDGLPLHQHLERRRSSASSRGNRSLPFGPSPGRAPRENVQPTFQPLPHVPESVPTQARATYPPPSQLYFGYAVREPGDGGFTSFDAVHPGFRTISGREQVLSALRTSTQPSHPIEAAPPASQVPVLHEQPSESTQAPSAAAQMPLSHDQSAPLVRTPPPVTQMPALHELPVSPKDAGPATTPTQPLPAPQLSKSGLDDPSGHRHGIAPPKVVGCPRPASFHEREIDPNTLWVQGSLSSGEAVRAMFSGFGTITEVSPVLISGLSKQKRFFDCSHTQVQTPRLRYMFISFERPEDAARARDSMANAGYEGGFLRVKPAFKRPSRVTSNQFEQRAPTTRPEPSIPQEQPRTSQPVYLPGDEPCVITPDGKKFYRADLVASAKMQDKAGEQDDSLQASSKPVLKKQQHGAKSQNSADGHTSPSPRKGKKGANRKKKRADSEQSSVPLSKKTSEIALTSLAESKPKKAQSKPKPKQKAKTRTVEAPKQEDGPIEPTEATSKESVASPAFDGVAETAPRASSSPIPEDDSVIAAKLASTTSPENKASRAARRSVSPASSHDDSILAAKLVGQPAEHIDASTYLIVGATSTGSPIMLERQPPLPQTELPLAQPNLEEPPFASRPDADTLLEGGKSAAPVVKLPTPQRSESGKEEASSQPIAPESTMEKVDALSVEVEEGQQSASTMPCSAVSASTPHKSRILKEAGSEGAPPVSAEANIEDSTQEPQTTTAPTTGEKASTSAGEAKSKASDDSTATNKALTQHASAALEEPTKFSDQTQSSVQDPAITSSSTAQAPMTEDEFPSLATSAHLAKTTSKRSPPLKATQSSTQKGAHSAATKKRPPKIAIPLAGPPGRGDARKSASDASPKTHVPKADKSPKSRTKSLSNDSTSLEDKARTLVKIAAPTTSGATSTSSNEAPTLPTTALPDNEKGSKVAETAMICIANDGTSKPVASESKASKVAKESKKFGAKRQSRHDTQVTTEGAITEAKDDKASAENPQSSTYNTKSAQAEPMKTTKGAKATEPGTHSVTPADVMVKSTGSTGLSQPSNQTLQVPPVSEVSKAVSTHKKSTKKKKRSPHPSAKLVLADALKDSDVQEQPLVIAEDEPTPTSTTISTSGTKTDEPSEVQSKRPDSPPGGYSIKEGAIEPECVEMPTTFPVVPPGAPSAPSAPSSGGLTGNKTWDDLRSSAQSTLDRLGQNHSQDSSTHRPTSTPLMNALDWRLMLLSVRNQLAFELRRSPTMDEVQQGMRAVGHDVGFDDLAEELEKAPTNANGELPGSATSAASTAEHDSSASATAKEDSAASSDAGQMGSAQAPAQSRRLKGKQRSKAKKAAFEAKESKLPDSQPVNEQLVSTDPKTSAEGNGLSTGRNKDLSNPERVLLNPDYALRDESSRSMARGRQTLTVFWRKNDNGDENSDPHAPTTEAVAFSPSQNRAHGAAPQVSAPSRRDDSSDTSTGPGVSHSSFSKRQEEYQDQKKGDYEVKRNAAKSLKQRNLQKVRRKNVGLVGPGEPKKLATEQAPEDCGGPDDRGSHSSEDDTKPKLADCNDPEETPKAKRTPSSRAYTSRKTTLAAGSHPKRSIDSTKGKKGEISTAGVQTVDLVSGDENLTEDVATPKSTPGGKTITGDHNKASKLSTNIDTSFTSSTSTDNMPFHTPPMSHPFEFAASGASGASPGRASPTNSSTSSTQGCRPVLDPKRGRLAGTRRRPSDRSPTSARPLLDPFVENKELFAACDKTFGTGSPSSAGSTSSGPQTKGRQIKPLPKSRTSSREARPATRTRSATPPSPAPFGFRTQLPVSAVALSDALADRAKLIAPSSPTRPPTVGEDGAIRAAAGPSPLLWCPARPCGPRCASRAGASSPLWSPPRACDCAASAAAAPAAPSPTPPPSAAGGDSPRSGPSPGRKIVPLKKGRSPARGDFGVRPAGAAAERFPGFGRGTAPPGEVTAETFPSLERRGSLASATRLSPTAASAAAASLGSRALFSEVARAGTPAPAPADAAGSAGREGPARRRSLARARGGWGLPEGQAVWRRGK